MSVILALLMCWVIGFFILLRKNSFHFSYITPLIGLLAAFLVAPIKERIEKVNCKSFSNGETYVYLVDHSGDYSTCYAFFGKKDQQLYCTTKLSIVNVTWKSTYELK